MTEDPLANPPSSPKGQVHAGEKPANRPPPHVALDISITDETWLEAVPSLKALLQKVATEVLKSPEAWGHFEGTPAVKMEISFCLADDSFVTRLNRKFCGKDKATNVLSFRSAEMFDGALHLGDITLASGIVIKEAEERQKPAAEHTTHLVIHGILHLLGFSHETDEDAAEMEALEIMLMKQFGFGDPYKMAKTD